MSTHKPVERVLRNAQRTVRSGANNHWAIVLLALMAMHRPPHVNADGSNPCAVSGNVHECYASSVRGACLPDHSVSNNIWDFPNQATGRALNATCDDDAPPINYALQNLNNVPTGSNACAASNNYSCADCDGPNVDDLTPNSGALCECFLEADDFDTYTKPTGMAIKKVEIDVRCRYNHAPGNNNTGPGDTGSIRVRAQLPTLNQQVGRDSQSFVNNDDDEACKYRLNSVESDITTAFGPIVWTEALVNNLQVAVRRNRDNDETNTALRVKEFRVRVTHCSDCNGDNICDPCDGQPDGTPCETGNLCTIDVCNAGCCVPQGLAPCDDGKECTENRCDPTSGCDYPNYPYGTPCGSPSNTYCDDPDTCDGAGNCIDRVKPAGTECRAAVGGTSGCDLPEVCDGSNKTCLTDIFRPNTYVCRPSVGTCDIAENCPGNAGACPVDGFAQSGTPCHADTIPGGGPNLCTIDRCNAVGACILAEIIDCLDDDLCTNEKCITSSGECEYPLKECDDDDECTDDSCNSNTGQCVYDQDSECVVGACCLTGGGCSQVSATVCDSDNGRFLGEGTSCSSGTCNTCSGDRLSTTKKGSLLIFSKVELRWDATGKLIQDTILTLANDFTRDTYVKLYFVNGDMPTDAIYADEAQTIILERAHQGWNQVDCAIELTENESTYLSMANGGGGCQRFTILDPGSPPGRPNLEPEGGRVLRGFVIAFAVDVDQEEISFNHLTGHADLINYSLRSSWEYQAAAFQAVNQTVGAATDGTPGRLNLDGVEYDCAFNSLLFDFFAVGSTALSNGGIAVMLDTDLTLHAVSTDLRQDSCGPVTTKAHFDIWNANEEFRSGTTRCITCWDQTLLSAYSEENNFMLADLDTDKGKARIHGLASVECDDLFVPNNIGDAIMQHFLNRREDCAYDINQSQEVALLGVAAKILSFSGGASGRTWAGMNLIGAGSQSAQILFDIPDGPETASSGSNRVIQEKIRHSAVGETKGK